MVCSKCGKEIRDDAVVCTNCGCGVDKRSTVAAILGFFLPLAGLLIYLIEKEKYPLAMKSLGKGALIGACVHVGIYILSLIVYVASLRAMIY